MRRLICCMIALSGSAVAAAEPFAFKENDRVALVGNTVIERAQNFGQVETLLTLAAGEGVKGVTFRNLGWSGDSVYGDARSYFGAPKEGRDRLKRAIGEIKPTVLLICYGTNVAMTQDQPWTGDPTGAERWKKGPDGGGEAFLAGYHELITLMREAAGESLREVVLISPPPLENLEPPYPDQFQRNKMVGEYGEVIADFAKKSGYRSLNLWKAMGGAKLEKGKPTPGPLTNNGVHYGDAGYTVMGEALVKGLGLKLPEGLSGNTPAVVALRKTVKKKNRLFFHRWRPANETYLFLFRKHEQGNNAKEIPMFDPLIEAEEKKIQALRADVFKNLKG